MQYKVVVYTTKKTKKGIEKKSLIASMVFSDKEQAIKQARCYKESGLLVEVIQI